VRVRVRVRVRVSVRVRVRESVRVRERVHVRVRVRVYACVCMRIHVLLSLAQSENGSMHSRRRETSKELATHVCRTCKLCVYKKHSWVLGRRCPCLRADVGV